MLNMRNMRNDYFCNNMPLQTQIKEMKKTLEQVTKNNLQKGMKKYGEEKTDVKNTWLNRIS